MINAHHVRTVELLRRARAGDEEALQSLVQHARGPLLARVRARLGPQARGVAESIDFLQDAFLGIIRDIEHCDIDDQEAFYAWAATIVRNRICDHMRRRREARMADFSDAGALFAPASGGESPPSILSRREHGERLRHALDELSPDHRRVLELRDFEGLGYREIAARMDRPSEEAVQMLHHRAMESLRRALARQGMGGP